MVSCCVWWIVCADSVSPFSSSPTRPAYCATDVVKRHQGKKSIVLLKAIKEDLGLSDKDKLHPGWQLCPCLGPIYLRSDTAPKDQFFGKNAAPRFPAILRDSPAIPRKMPANGFRVLFFRASCPRSAREGFSGVFFFPRGPPAIPRDSPRFFAIWSKNTSLRCGQRGPIFARCVPCFSRLSLDFLLSVRAATQANMKLLFLLLAHKPEVVQMTSAS